MAQSKQRYSRQQLDSIKQNGRLRAGSFHQRLAIEVDGGMQVERLPEDFIGLQSKMTYDNATGERSYSTINIKIPKLEFGDMNAKEATW